VLDQPSELGRAIGGDCRGARLHEGHGLLVGREPVAHAPFDGRRSGRRGQAYCQFIAHVNHLFTIPWPLESGPQIARRAMQDNVATFDKVAVDITVVLGTTTMPVHQALRLGRGAIIELDASEDDAVNVLANNLPVAKGTVVVNGNRIAVEVGELLPRPPDLR
jgi:flagellar motor switch protein FliN/FliY